MRNYIEIIEGRTTNIDARRILMDMSPMDRYRLSDSLPYTGNKKERLAAMLSHIEANLDDFSS